MEFMKESSTRISSTDRESSNTLMAMNMKESGKMIRWRAKEFINGLMEINMKEIMSIL
jgi:hypothetical protein